MITDVENERIEIVSQAVKRTNSFTLESSISSEAIASRDRVPTHEHYRDDLGTPQLIGPHCETGEGPFDNTTDCGVGCIEISGEHVQGWVPSNQPKDNENGVPYGI